jgi:hypothetical protein
MYICIYVYMYEYMYVCMFICACVSMCMFIFTYIYIFTHRYIHMYIYICMHIYRSFIFTPKQSAKLQLILIAVCTLFALVSWLWVLIYINSMIYINSSVRSLCSLLYLIPICIHTYLGPLYSLQSKALNLN